MRQLAKQVDALQAKMGRTDTKLADLATERARLNAVATAVALSEPSPPTNLPVVQLQPPAQPPPNEAAFFNAALRAYQQGQYNDAYELFERFVTDHPQHEKVLSARFWMGECQYEAGDYETAIHDYLYLLEHEKEHEKAAEALFKAALCYEKLQKTEEARRMFAELLQQYPHTGYADLAESHMQQPLDTRLK